MRFAAMNEHTEYRKVQFRKVLIKKLHSNSGNLSNLIKCRLEKLQGEIFRTRNIAQYVG
jgi:hypothetical protein